MAATFSAKLAANTFLFPANELREGREDRPTTNQIIVVTVTAVAGRVCRISAADDGADESLIKSDWAGGRGGVIQGRHPFCCLDGSLTSVLAAFSSNGPKWVP